MRAIGNSYVAYVRVHTFKRVTYGAVIKFLVVTTMRGGTREYWWINYEFVLGMSIQQSVAKRKFLFQYYILI